MSDVIWMTRNEWVAEGTRLFGSDMMKWEFICPSCGHVQTSEDFRPYKDQIKGPDVAHFSCIGRWDGHMDRDAFGKKNGGPCNYAGGGLFAINPVIVVADGKEHKVFAFNALETKGDSK